MNAIIIGREDRMRLGSMLASRASIKTRDAEDAMDKQRSSHLIENLKRDAEWSRRMAQIFMSDDPVEMD